jgi:hypothetical protein
VGDSTLISCVLVQLSYVWLGGDCQVIMYQLLSPCIGSSHAQAWRVAPASPQNVPAYIFTLLSKRGRTAKQAAAAKTAAEAALIHATLGHTTLGHTTLGISGLGFPATGTSGSPIHLGLPANGGQDGRMPPAALASPSALRNSMIGKGLNFWRQGSTGTLSPVPVQGSHGLGTGTATLHSFSVPPSPGSGMYQPNRPYLW